MTRGNIKRAWEELPSSAAPLGWEFSDLRAQCWLTFWPDERDPNGIGNLSSIEDSLPVSKISIVSRDHVELR